MDSCFNEHSVVELNDGRLWRLSRGMKEALQSYSADGGKTWQPQSTAFPHVNSKCAWGTNQRPPFWETDFHGGFLPVPTAAGLEDRNMVRTAFPEKTNSPRFLFPKYQQRTGLVLTLTQLGISPLTRSAPPG